MKIRKSGEDYLEAILILERQSGAVRSIDLARHMGYSKASISHATSALRKGGFLVMDKDGCLLIDRAAYDEEETGIKTIYGDDVCAIDTHNGIVIVSLDGDGYAGRMAIVKNSEQVRLATAPNLGSAGSYLDRICEKMMPCSASMPADFPIRRVQATAERHSA